MRAELDLDDARDEDEALAQLAVAARPRRARARRSPPCSGVTRALGFTPGLRVPGGEGYEMAVRAVLTQQIS